MLRSTRVEVFGPRSGVVVSNGGTCCYSTKWSPHVGAVGGCGEQGCSISAVGADAMECGECRCDLSEYGGSAGTGRGGRCKVAANVTNYETGC